MRARARFPIALIILLECCACAFALDPKLDVSQYAHTSWRVRDGFAKGAILCIAQSADGYLWIGTEFGLVRFDGVRTFAWQPPAGQQLPGSQVSSLLVARDGTLWIGTDTGLASWDNHKLTTYPELAQSAVLSLLQDRSGTIWIGSIELPSAGKLCTANNSGLQCRGDGEFGPGVESLYEDSTGNLWVAVSNGFWRWKPGRSEFFAVPHITGGIWSLAEDDRGALLIAAPKGIQRLANGRLEENPFPGIARPYTPLRMLRDRDGGLWISTSDRGLLHLHESKADAFSQSDGLSANFARALLEDREGNIWAATFNGLDRFRGYAVPNVSVKQGLSGLATSVLATKDSVWIGTTSGLSREKDNHVSAFSARVGSGQSAGKLNGLSPESLFQDSSGRTWASTNREFGYLENGRFIPERDLPPGFVHDIAEVGRGHLWVANQQAGLFHVYENRVVQQIPWAGLGHNDFALVLAADPSNSALWLGFFGGGVAYLSEGGIKAFYSAANGLGQGKVSGLRVDTYGALWVATEGGLSRIKEGHISTLTSKNGLPCNSVHWSMEDNDHFLWVYTSCGLIRIARSDLDAWVADPTSSVKLTLFDASDGVPSHFNAGGISQRVAKATDGKLWFLSFDGVSFIDPLHLSFNKIPPPVQVEQIIADDKTYSAASGFHLPAHVRNLTIEYTALSLTVPERVHFRYKLEGQDKDWKEVINERLVRYTNLSPKHYRFRVLACNNSGVWNEEGASLDFVIPPAWYQTNWFRALCVSLFLSLLWLAYQIRVWHLRQQFAITLDARVVERTRIARELHDTLLQSLHGLLLSFQRAANLLPDRPVEAKARLEGAIDEAAQAITEGRDAVQGLRSSMVVTNELAEAIRTLGAELATREASENPPLFDVVVEGAPRDLNPILRDDVYRIACEALRNAFQHAEARHIEVELHYDERRLRLRVRDDGKGVAPEVFQSKGRSGHWGLQGMRERAKVAGGQLEIWSEANSGTEIELSIPASAAYAAASGHSRKGTTV